jgi:Xaa-Pro aminopeptidase
MRIKKLIESLNMNELDAFIITQDPNIYYYTGSISGGILVITPDHESTLFTSKLNLNVALDQTKGAAVKTYTRENMINNLAEACKEVKPKKIGFDSLSIINYNSLNEKLEAELTQETDIVWAMRRVKDPKEIGYMKKAAEQVIAGMESAMNAMKQGTTEYELAAEASYSMRKKGADDYAFPFIVASGPRSAYPHAGVTDRKIKKGDLITIDMGARHKGYCIDLTRTFIMGELTEKQRKIYTTVHDANVAAFPHYKEGNKGIVVDKVSRDIIEKAGYGEYYIHSLGHGIGLEVHEPPSLSNRSKDKIEAGNVISNEPGIYLHGYGGVRIEDSVYVTKEKPINLTKFPKSLDEIIV